MGRITRNCNMPVPGLGYPRSLSLCEYEHIFGERSSPVAEKDFLSPLYDDHSYMADEPFPNVRSQHLRTLLQNFQTLTEMWRHCDQIDDLQVRNRCRDLQEDLRRFP